MSERTNRCREARGRIVAELRRELLGPSEPEEAITEFPSTRYVVGRLAPARSAENDGGATVDVAENDTLGAGADDEEAGAEEPPVPLVLGFNPSSMGLSFLVDQSVDTLDVKISWGDYRREAIDGRAVWKRYARAGVVTGVQVASRGKIAAIPLSAGAGAAGAVVGGVDDAEVCLEGVVHTFAGEKAVSLFFGKSTDQGCRTGSRQRRTLDLPTEHLRHGRRAGASLRG